MKYLYYLLFFMFGGAVGTLLINWFVIGGQQDATFLSSAQKQAIYNLHDYLLDYVIFFLGGVFMSLFFILALKQSAKYK